MHAHSAFEAIILADLILLVTADIERHRAAYFFIVIARDLQMLVLFDLFILIVFDDQVAVMLDQFHAIILDTDVLIFLGMDKYLLGSLLVFDSKLVEAAAALR